MRLATVGLRTDPRRTWRSGVATALLAAVGEPRLWLLGALGFAARGGLVILAVPILTIPTPVVLSTIFRGQLSTSGISGISMALIAAVVIGALILALLALLAAAYADVAAFELLVSDPDTDDLRATITPLSIDRKERLFTVIALAGIQAIALVPALIIAALIASRVQGTVVQELTLPSSFTTPLYFRVLSAVGEPLMVLASAVLMADIAYSLAGRAILVTMAGLDGHGQRRRMGRRAIGGMLRVATHPVRTLATAVLAWPVTLIVLAPVLWAAAIAWSGVRSVLLTPSGLSEPAALIPPVIAVTILAASWIAATILAGFASAVRAALWSADALR